MKMLFLISIGLSSLFVSVYSDRCSTHYQCGLCIADYGCGWCAETGVCQLGSSAGSEDQTCTGEGIWTVDYCPTVCDHPWTASCMECTTVNGCGWCESTQKCLPGHGGGDSSHFPPDNNACDQVGWSMKYECEGVYKCSNFTDCVSCTQAASSGCGWCASSGTCLFGSPSQDKYQTCAFGEWKWKNDWNPDLCVPKPQPAPVVNCSVYHTCSDCQNGNTDPEQPECGWCGDDFGCQSFEVACDHISECPKEVSSSSGAGTHLSKTAVILIASAVTVLVIGSACMMWSYCCKRDRSMSDRLL